MFDVTRYLGEPVDRIGTTVEVYYCPCCNRKSLKVNIRKESKPYKCWSGGCSNDSIRKALRLTVQPKAEIIKPRSLNIKPIRLEKIEPIIVSDYISPTTVRYGIHDNKPATITTYRYGNFHQVERIDFHGEDKKKFLPSYIQQGRRVYGADYNCPLFNQELIENNKTVYFVEGEKCADILTREVGVLAVTPPGFGWNDKYLRQALQRIAFKVNGIVILPDKDETGEKKASLVRCVAWSLGIPCNVVKIPGTKAGEDVVDLLNRNVDVFPYIK